jgi:signal transduction histidine kinase
MRGSFRRRLLAIAALTLLACGAAIVAVLILSKMTMEVRIDHGRENVTREVERLRGVVEPMTPAQRAHRTWQSGELVSGYESGPSDGDQGPFVAEAVAQAAREGGLVVLDRTDGDPPTLVAAVPVSGGGAVFAIQHVVAGRETRSLRVVVLVLALLSFGLVVASLRTLGAVERGVSSLRASLRALAKDLHAPVARPALRELDEVAAGVAALAEDLSRAQAERERLTHELGDRERLAALGRVAAGVAHEVRNPLAAMKLRADLARTGGEATPAVARDLEDIASEISRLDRLVSDLLIVAGRRAGPRDDVDVGQLVGKRVALITPWAMEKGVKVEWAGSARAPLDADAIARAVDNLLRNAVEASPGGARVEARVAREGGKVLIDVVDRGKGVPHDRAGELFEPFFTTKPDGTGLGLALARAVAASHDGTLTYSRDGDATRFCLTLDAPAAVG